MQADYRSHQAARARRAGDIVMDDFDIPRLAGWGAAIVVSLGIWAVIIVGLTML
jgi:hypothetical protein